MTLTAPETKTAPDARDHVPRPEYPRPHFDRSARWASLNGAWEFRRGHRRDEDADQDWPERITVPFAWETAASGVGAHWLVHGRYRRAFTIDPSWAGERVILHFGAVHHEATVWVDGNLVGSHEGGYTPFEFDITDALSGAGEHELVVAVAAPGDKLAIAHGKQRSMPRDDYDGCAFTPSSGIWQSVWLEPRPATYLSSLSLRPSRELDAIIVSGDVAGTHIESAMVSITVEGTGAEWHGQADLLAPGVRVAITAPQLWSPQDPHLYRVRVEVDSADGLDVVTGSTGLRRVETRDGAVFLNGQRISLRGVLDQGYWPGSGITAPSDAAFVRDLELAREAGFNLVRKHLKMEDPRFHYHADRLGMLVWAEPASTGRYSTAGIDAFNAQIAPMVTRDGDHPSIIIWGLYNEEWGLDWGIPEDPEKQADVRASYRRLKVLDASRPIVDNSGWAHVETDLLDWHIYDEHPKGWADKVANLMRDLSASAQPSFPVGIDVGRIVPKLLCAAGPVPEGVPVLNSEFGGGFTALERGWNLHWQTQELRRYDRIAGWVWTELYDIEHESAGIWDADRRLKDHGGRPPRDANAETAPVFDIMPVAPGRDIVAPAGDVAFNVAVSHHGAERVEVDVALAWGPALGEEPSSEARHLGVVTAEPFELSGPVAVRETLPDGFASGRLHVLLLSDGAVIGRGSLDVSRV